jgi:hypothetical protein
MGFAFMRTLATCATNFIKKGAEKKKRKKKTRFPDY